MSQARLPEHRYWVQVELEPTGQGTVARQLDLNMVDGVTLFRGNEREVLAVEVLYAGAFQPLKIAKSGALNFLKHWEKYCAIPDERKDDIAKLGVIHLPHGVVPLVK